VASASAAADRADAGWAPATRAVHLGRPTAAGGQPLNAPVVFSATFHQGGPPRYGRDDNPTWEALEAAVGGLEGGTAVAFASGMAAIAAVLELLPVPGRVVVPGDAYNGTRRFLADVAGRGRLRFRTVEVGDTAAVLATCAELVGAPGRPAGGGGGGGGAAAWAGGCGSGSAAASAVAVAVSAGASAGVSPATGTSIVMIGMPTSTV
jgi:hypothetical protein